MVKKKAKFHIEFKSSAQKMAYQLFQQHDVLFMVGPAGTGKAQSLNSLVYCIDGPKKMGNITLNDKVLTPNGGSASVIGIFPQGKKDMYKITFNDGSYTKCCKEHLWKVGHIQNGWKDKVVDTEFIINNHKNKYGRNVLYIDATKPVQYNKKKYKILPYLMGILLSEGQLGYANIDFTTEDEEILENAAVGLAEEYVFKPNKNTYRIVRKHRTRKPNFYKEECKRLNLYGTISTSKFIPKEYLVGSIDQRIELLQGLMDGDGTVARKTGMPSFSTSSKQLARDMTNLVNSLGGTVRTTSRIPTYNYKGMKRKGKRNYCLHLCLPNEISCFKLNRKNNIKKDRIKYFPRRYVSLVEYTGKESAQCILINSKDHLYLTDNYIVTHNTHLSMAFAINEILQKTKKRIILTRPIVESGESLGFLPGEFEEKVAPWMHPLYDVMGKLVGYDNQREQIMRCVEVAPLAYMRGRTFSNSICIFDEAQNATLSQLKLFLSRLDVNSKIIVNGDPLQSDIGDRSALVDVMQRLETVRGIGTIRFKSDSIIRHSVVKDILERLEE